MLDSCAQSAVTMGGSPESLDNRCSESPGWHGLHIRHDHPPCIIPDLTQASHSLCDSVTVPGNTPAPPPIYSSLLSSLRSQEWADGRDGRLAPPGDSLCTGAWWLTSWQSRQNAVLVILVSFIYVNIVQYLQRSLKVSDQWRNDQIGTWLISHRGQNTCYSLLHVCPQ